MRQDRLIVMEGASDGVGKTTQIGLLKDHLERDGMKVVGHHFPSYHSYQGKPVEMYLTGNYGSPESLSPYFINSLYAVDRAITWLTELKSAFESGNIILLDRYTTSSIIYQSSLLKGIEAKKQFIDYVSDYEYGKLGIPEPNKVIFLYYSSFEIITKIRNRRVGNDGVQNDIHETNLDYLKKTYENAMFVADYLKWYMICCNVGNNLRTKEEIHEEIYQLVKTK